jgi:hypothetical protein
MQPELFSRCDVKNGDNVKNLESRLIALLASEISREHDKNHNIYNVSWAFFALKNVGRHNEQFHDKLHQELSLLLERTSSEDLRGYLYDYRRAVGVALSIWLIGVENLGLSEGSLKEICEVLTSYSEESEIGELVGATFLLIRHLKDKVLEERMGKVMHKIKELGQKDPAYRLIDLLYVAFFSAIAGDEQFCLEVIELIRKNDFMLAYVKNDPEKLVLFLYMVSKAVDSGKCLNLEWCREQRDAIAQHLMIFLNNLPLSHCLSLMDALISAAGGFKVRPVKEVRGGEAVIDLRDIDLIFPHPDFISKTTMALFEAGYLQPFTLSRKEADVYRQIRAEVKGYRRVRKPEMVILLTSFALFLLLLPLICGLVAFHLDVSQVVFPYICYCTFMGCLIYAFIVNVWKRGYVTLRDLLKAFKEGFGWLVERMKRS